jgi:hypothetical protein
MQEGRYQRVLRGAAIAAALGGLCAVAARAQVIEFYSAGLRYVTQTKNGLTVMYAEMPLQIRGYAVAQVAVINGSEQVQTMQPAAFSFRLPDGREVRATAEHKFVAEMFEHGGRGDVIKLVTTYEKALYGAERIRSNNGYEQRRQAALAMGGSAGVKAAAAASAIALVRTKLKPKDSTDGAVFFYNYGKALGAGTLRAQVGSEYFEFPVTE